MSAKRKPFPSLFVAVIFALLSLSALSGCASLGMGGDDEASSLNTQPYRAHEFTDVVIPSELTWDRERSMLVRTDSFAGGVLQYSGRVEIASLADFFTNSMVRNGWKLAGSAKYKNILLAFTKQNKTCTILLSEDKLLFKTDVSIYMAEDTSAGSLGSKTPVNPFGSPL